MSKSTTNTCANPKSMSVRGMRTCVNRAKPLSIELYPINYKYVLNTASIFQINTLIQRHAQQENFQKSKPSLGPISPSSIPFKGRWSTRLRSCTINGCGPKLFPWVMRFAYTIACVAVWPNPPNTVCSMNFQIYYRNQV